MTKKGASLVLAAVLLLTGATMCAASGLKIGYVDIQRAVAESMAGQAANENFITEANRLRDDILREKERIEQMAEMYEKQSMMLSADVRRNKEMDLMRRQRDYERMVEDSKVELQVKESELTNDILEDLIPIIQEYARKHGFSIIFERSEQVLLYVVPSLDVTDKIIEIYNVGFQKKP